MPRQYGLLSVEEHSRASAGMTYVYPVVSRRAGGVSVGINLNPNNACNWQCVYCQVPDLTRGGPPPIDLKLLQKELDSLLDDLQSGQFMEKRVPVEARKLQDIAFSGNGEPTTAVEFANAVALVVETLRSRSLLGRLKIRLISNGSQIDKNNVRRSLALMSDNNGEVWFKLDAATASGINSINGIQISPESQLRRLRTCAELCPTWIQSCFFMRDNQPPLETDMDIYVAAIESVADVVSGVHLYGIARPSMQADAARLGRLPEAWFNLLARRLEDQGLLVTINP